MSEWIEHKGGECPVHEDTIVEIIMKCERDSDETVQEPVVAAALVWPWVGDDYDIFSYRVASQPK